MLWGASVLVVVEVGVLNPVVPGIGSGLVVVVFGVVEAGISADDEVASSVVVVAGLDRLGGLVVLLGAGGPAGSLSPWPGVWFRAKAITTATTAVPVPVAATA